MPMLPELSKLDRENEPHRIRQESFDTVLWTEAQNEALTTTLVIVVQAHSLMP